MGCPVRLANALELLFSLPEQARKECLNGLRNIHTHLPTVEELIWPTLWLGKSELYRGGNLASNGTQIDWFFFANGIPVYLESKFRPSDWPRVSDRGTYQPMNGFFLGKAAKQFPQPSGPLTMHVVGVTGTNEPTPDMLARCEDELANSPTVHAILYRTFLGSETHFHRNSADSLICGDPTPIKELIDYDPFCGVSVEIGRAISQGKPTRARRAAADEADRSVDGNPSKPGVCMSVLFQARRCPPDLKHDFLIQVVPVSGVPRINPADLENPGAIPVDQSQKLPFVWWPIECSEPLTD